MGSAADPDAEKSLEFTPNLTSGRDLDGKPSAEVDAHIGSGLAKSMNVNAGDGLNLLAVTSDGALNGVDVQIVGVVSSGIATMDDRYLHITL
jgi:putative ABC transport system permease protein